MLKHQAEALFTSLYRRYFYSAAFENWITVCVCASKITFNLHVGIRVVLHVNVCIFYYDSDYDVSSASQKRARLQQALQTHCLLIRLNGCLANGA